MTEVNNIFSRDNVWYFLDQAGNEQGPFPSREAAEQGSNRYAYEPDNYRYSDEVFYE